MLVHQLGVTNPSPTPSIMLVVTRVRPHQLDVLVGVTLIITNVSVTQFGAAPYL
jgi:hypothetical protein